MEIGRPLHGCWTSWFWKGIMAITSGVQLAAHKTGHSCNGMSL